VELGTVPAKGSALSLSALQRPPRVPYQAAWIIATWTNSSYTGSTPSSLLVARTSQQLVYDPGACVKPTG